MSPVEYYKGIRAILFILLVGTAWFTLQKYIPQAHGIVGSLIDALLLIMVDIKIKEYENDL